MAKNVGGGIILIILGLVVLAFPLMGLIAVSALSGFLVLLLGIGLLLAGVSEMGESAALGLVEIILGIIALILGIGFIFNPALFSWVVGFIIWIIGLFLVIAGIVGIFTKTGGSRWNGVIALVIGILYIIVGLFVKNPIVLGVLIGLWLLITGIMMLVAKD